LDFAPIKTSDGLDEVAMPICLLFDNVYFGRKFR